MRGELASDGSSVEQPIMKRKLSFRDDSTCLTDPDATLPVGRGLSFSRSQPIDLCSTDDEEEKCDADVNPADMSTGPHTLDELTEEYLELPSTFNDGHALEQHISTIYRVFGANGQMDLDPIGRVSVKRLLELVLDSAVTFSPPGSCRCF